MFDDLNDNSGFSPEAASKPPAENRSSYQDRPQGNSYGQNRPQGGGGYGGGGGGFQRKEDKVDDPYLPIAVFVDKEFSEQAKTSLFHIASKLIAKGYTVRIFGDDKEFVQKVTAVSTKFVEVYLPWRNFNEIESKHTWNTLTAKDIAAKQFSGWDKIPDAVKGILASQVRIIFGDRNNSPVMSLITWSRDGATRASEVTKDTGRVGFIIKMASSYGFGVLNIAKESSGAIIERTYGI